MIQPYVFSFCLVGIQSLIIECGEFLLHRGHSLCALISDDEKVQSWALSHQISCFNTQDEFLKNQHTSCDYLFSINNFSKLTLATLNKANKLAINFHDGILPHYSGLNPTSWAIINNEKEHAITWHVMEEKIATGAILFEQRFPIEPDETAFSLNAKCYEYCLETFKILVEKIEQTALIFDQSLRPISLAKKYYYSWHRPSALAVINWQDSLEKIEALVRGLNFGPYPNPVAIPKIGCNNDWWTINAITMNERQQQASTVQADGFILAVEEKIIKVVLGGKIIQLEGGQDLLGRTIDWRNESVNELLKPGMTLVTLSDNESALLDKTALLLAQDEPYWRAQLSHIEPLSLTYFEQAVVDLAKRDKIVEQIKQKIIPFTDWSEDFNEAQWLAAIVTGLARISHQHTFSISTHHPKLHALLATLKTSHRIDKLFSERVPFQFNICFDQSFAHNVEKIKAQCDEQFLHHTFALDLISRMNDTSGRVISWQDEEHDIALSWLNNEPVASFSLPAKAKLHFIFDFSNQQIILRYASSHEEPVQALQVLLSTWVQALKNCTLPVAEVPFLTAESKTKLDAINQTQKTVPDTTVHYLFEQQAEKTPEAVALVVQNRLITFRDLNEKANRLAHYLIEEGVEIEDRIGVMLDRSEWMIISLLATQKAGAAYVPMDPSYPVDRLKFMAEDSGVKKIITRAALATLLPEFEDRFLKLDEQQAAWQASSSKNPILAVLPHHLIYVMYTSGSTGKPKGVMVEHRNIVNFIIAMDEQIGEKEGTFCSVTSMSFDISVLELYWSLTRGFKVVLYRDPFAEARKESELKKQQAEQNIDFSLFFWNQASEDSLHDQNKYSLLLNVTEEADRLGLKAVWVPERHFGTFGGNYPNPSVIAAALAVRTKQIEIRAGSCVLPLHHPVRVAEEWAVVDNLSNGRIAIAFASGWQPNDFVLMPDNFARAKEIFFDHVDFVRKLWRGEEVSFKGPKGDVKVRTLPRPIQKELPFWITAAANPETFRKAGETGAKILTHLLGQTLEKLVENIAVYQAAWQAAGFAGKGHVTLMLHTLVGDNEHAVRETARAPMKAYLKSAMYLLKEAAWDSPTFKKMSAETGKTIDTYFEHIQPDELDAILEFAFERYYEKSGLFGSYERCLAMIDRLKSIGVSEVACLVDYGLNEDQILAHLPHLAKLMTACKATFAPDVSDTSDAIQIQAEEQVPDLSLAELCLKHQVTHFQCTPSQGRMLLEEENGIQALKQLKYFLMGGEALPRPLAHQLLEKMKGTGKLINVYGPTETTVWSTCFHVTGEEAAIPIGRPLANTRIYVLDRFGRRVPMGVAGELGIAGLGVVRGYFNRPQLTNERFIKEQAVTQDGFADDARVYLTGDLVRLREDGILEYLGRTDYQVKIRGFRIELGEIESVISEFPSVDSVAVVIKSIGEHKQLIAFVTENKKYADRLCVTALKQFLQSRLPDFMVPSPLVFLDKMPLTPNGKINRLALPDPNNQPVHTHEKVLPESQVEKSVADIWCQALARESVGIHDNFFDIGGHSLLVVKVLAELKKAFTKPIQLTDLFRYTTIQQLASFFKDDATPKNERVEDSRQRAMARREMLAKKRR